jgi:hypothetical protein
MESSAPPSGAREQPFRDRVIEPAVERLAKLVLRINPKTNVDGVRGKLLAAGLGRTVSPTVFLAAKAAVGIGRLFVGAALQARSRAASAFSSASGSAQSAFSRPTSWSAREPGSVAS